MGASQFALRNASMSDSVQIRNAVQKDASPAFSRVSCGSHESVALVRRDTARLSEKATPTASRTKTSGRLSRSMKALADSEFRTEKIVGWTSSNPMRPFSRPNSPSPLWKHAVSKSCGARMFETPVVIVNRRAPPKKLRELQRASALKHDAVLHPAPARTRCLSPSSTSTRIGKIVSSAFGPDTIGATVAFRIIPS